MIPSDIKNTFTNVSLDKTIEIILKKVYNKMKVVFQSFYSKKYLRS